MQKNSQKIGVRKQQEKEKTMPKKQVQKSAKGQQEEVTNDVNENNSETVVIEEQVNIQNPSMKRKQKSDAQGSQQKKGGASEAREKPAVEPVTSGSESDMDEQGAEDSESQTLDEDTGSRKGRERPYSVGKIKQSTKNMRGVKVEDHFADKERFLVSVRSHMYNNEKSWIHRPTDLQAEKDLSESQSRPSQ